MFFLIQKNISNHTFVINVIYFFRVKSEGNEKIKQTLSTHSDIE